MLFDEGVIWNQRAISFVEVAIERERWTCLWVIYRVLVETWSMISNASRPFVLVVIESGTCLEEDPLERKMVVVHRGVGKRNSCPCAWLCGAAKHCHYDAVGENHDVA